MSVSFSINLLRTLDLYQKKEYNEFSYLKKTFQFRLLFGPFHTTKTKETSVKRKMPSVPHDLLVTAMSAIEYARYRPWIDSFRYDHPSAVFFSLITRLSNVPPEMQTLFDYDTERLHRICYMNALAEENRRSEELHSAYTNGEFLRSPADWDGSSEENEADDLSLWDEAEYTRFWGGLDGTMRTKHLPLEIQRREVFILGRADDLIRDISEGRLEDFLQALTILLDFHTWIEGHIEWQYPLYQLSTWQTFNSASEKIGELFSKLMRLAERNNADK